MFNRVKTLQLIDNGPESFMTLGIGPTGLGGRHVTRVVAEETSLERGLGEIDFKILAEIYGPLLGLYSLGSAGIHGAKLVFMWLDLNLLENFVQIFYLA